MEVEGCPHLTNNNYTSSLQGQTICKDQCTRCFADAKDPQGLNLCLKCFNGQCLSQFNHSQLHYEKTGHCLVLNIKMTIQEDKPREEKEVFINTETKKGDKITKIAIGKEGGANIGGPIYKTDYSLFCYICNKTVDSKPIEGVIQSVQNAQSNFKKADLVAWELEIFPCEHTLTIQQEPVKKQDMSKCGKCDLSTNLWMCLICGNLGCGRKQYDGSGGNNHGVQHFEETGHSLSVKMGTITAEGDASVFCYSCGQDVKDDSLPNHLAVFGLDVNTQKKTEKTMAEMTLDANLALTLSSILEEGKSLFPLFGPEKTGLENIGNSCYMNSVLQTIFSLPEFQQRYYHEKGNHIQECNKQKSNECYLCQMCKLAHGLISGKYSIKKETLPTMDPDGNLIEVPEHQKYYQDGIKIVDFKQMIGKGRPEFTGTQMQDSLEYMEHLLSTIQKYEKQENLSDITKIFQYKSVNKMKCTVCASVKVKEQQNNQLKLPVRHPTHQELELAAIEKQKLLESTKTEQQKLEKALELNFEEPQYDTSFMESMQNLSEGEQLEVFCPKCNQTTVFQANPYFKTVPKYLLVAMNRFVAVNWVPKKLNAMIEIGGDLDLKDYIYKGLEQGEILIQDKKANDQPEVNEDSLANLMVMGFSENRCKRALLACKNDPEAASNWIFERMDDASLDEPIQKSTKPGKNVNQEDVETVMAMGFSDKAATFALQKCDNNVERAVDFLFSHDNVEQLANEDAKPEEQEVDEEIISTKYKLHAAIVHLGKSASSGHYVTYINQDGKWILYNDSKVAETPDPVLGKGYFYIFKRI